MQPLDSLPSDELPDSRQQSSRPRWDGFARVPWAATGTVACAVLPGAWALPLLLVAVSLVACGPGSSHGDRRYRDPGAVCAERGDACLQPSAFVDGLRIEPLAQTPRRAVAGAAWLASPAVLPEGVSVALTAVFTRDGIPASVRDTAHVYAAYFDGDPPYPEIADADIDVEAEPHRLRVDLDALGVLGIAYTE